MRDKLLVLFRISLIVRCSQNEIYNGTYINGIVRIEQSNRLNCRVVFEDKKQLEKSKEVNCKIKHKEYFCC